MQKYPLCACELKQDECIDQHFRLGSEGVNDDVGETNEMRVSIYSIGEDVGSKTGHAGCE